jgi:parallel beta-helix repeat protein
MKKLILICILANTFCQGATNFSYTVNSISQQGVTILKHNVDINSPFQINSSDVVLDMNNKTIRGGILINAGLSNIVIKNGIVDPTTTTTVAAINVQTGCQNIQLINLKIRNAQSGIFFQTVTNSLIQNCEITATSTGVLLSGCSNVIIDNVLAQNNLNRGFSLLTSGTCILRDCRAINTGLGNNSNATNNSIIGFESNNGTGNLFERCISNATQALSTIDFGSIVAGFALRGSEQFSKIIECEASNAITSALGVTVPYGILLQSTVNMNVLLPIAQDFTVATQLFSYPLSVSWSPDGRYFATAEANPTNKGQQQLFVYQFNRQQFDLIHTHSIVPISSVAIQNSVEVQSIGWSPSGNYIALTETVSDNVFIYQFEPVNNNLMQIAVSNISPGNPVNLNWRFDNQFFAVADSALNRVLLYKFDQVAQILTQVAIVATSLAPVSLHWSPDGNFLAVAETNGSGSGFLQIYSFSQASQTLNLVASQAFTNPVGVSWSPNGLYLALVNDNSFKNTVITYGSAYILSFNRNSFALTTLINDSPTGFLYYPLGVVWSPDSRLIGIPANPVGHFPLGAGVDIYSLDPGTPSLTFVTALNKDFCAAADWSPDGAYLVVATNNTSPGISQIAILPVLFFPNANVIKGNITYCNSGSKYPNGVGISGSSIQNYIVGNTAYANPFISSSSTSQLVGTNYLFVPNVFNPLFEQGPTSLENISIDLNEAIPLPADLDIVLQQVLLALETGITSQLAAVSSKLSIPNTALDQLDILTTCSSITVSTPTTISQSGTYCLGNSIIGSVRISGSDIVLSLNNYQISQGLTIATGSNRIGVRDGFIQNTAGGTGLTILSSSNIFLENLQVTNSATAISLSTVYGGSIKNCRVRNSIDGIFLSSCANIALDDSIAENIQLLGFSLVDSTTCFVGDCKAINVGSTNLLQSISSGQGGVIGFNVQGGYGNIFERCIANSTLGLTVTDSSSIVAGFRLGFDSNNVQTQANKIINCESSNAATSANGVTVPYGILLQAQVSGLTPVTSIDPGGAVSADTILTVAWSPDGQYVAIGGQTNGGSAPTSTLLIYKFDYFAKSLIQVVASDILGSNADFLFSIAWSPDGNYLALAGSLSPFRTADDFLICSFNRTNQTLTKLQGFHISSSSTDVFSVSWAPNGNYVVVGGSHFAVAYDDILLYGFNPITQTATLLQTVNVTPYASDNVQAIAWSPDGNYVAAGVYNTGTGGDLLLYSFTPATNLVHVDTQFPSSTGGFFARSVAWSPNGKYLALAGHFDTGKDLVIYRLNTATQKFGFVTSIATASSDPRSVVWSPDGQYVAIGNTGVSDALVMYLFNPGSPSLTQVAATNPAGGTDTIFVSWSPDGQYLAAAGVISGGSLLDLFIYQALTFPSANVITNNTVYCNSGSQYLGIGISGSSIANMIIQNSAYSNPIFPQGSGRTQVAVGTDYAFVPNVLNSSKGLELSLVQNAAIDCFQPFIMPDNVALLLRQDIADVFALGRCDGTAIVAAPPIISGSLENLIVLSSSGNYCLGADIAAQMIISTTGVSLNLNGHCFMGTMTVQNAQYVIIENGTIEAPAVMPGVPSTLNPSGAITIASSAQNIIVRNVRINTGSGTTTTDGVRPGIITAGQAVTIRNCVIETGNGFTNATPTSAAIGIRVDGSSSQVIIRDCTIFTGQGGDNATTTTANGGNGIEVLSGANSVEILNCFVETTGRGGNATVPVGGSSGGHGIQIDSGAVGVAVTNCVIRNTGAAGTGTSSSNGLAGRAVNDLVTTLSSQVFSNFAHDIANATKFDLQATNIESGIKTPNPPTAAPINPFANVFT